MEAVVCEADATQSYALYLPSSYTPARSWPIVYFFDPGGRGYRPVELYKDIAEKYGFVIAGSNNSRNFSPSDSSNSMSAIWQDTHLRLALDERRTYTSGFSGGARVAGSMALGCSQCLIGGVIAHGAGYPNSSKSPARDKMPYFLAVGDQDFNWGEVIGIRRQREEQGLPYRVRVFSGPHQWAPAAVMEDALEWVILKGMQARSQPADAAFIDRFFLKMQAEAEDAGKRGDAITELSAYRSLVSDFGGLKDVAEYERKLAALKRSADLKTALKKEQEQIAEQDSLEAEIRPKLQVFATGSLEDPFALHRQLLQDLRQLKDEATRAKSEVKHLVAMRAFRGMWAEGIETGQQEFLARHFDTAEEYFQLMSSVSEDPWPLLLLAETRTAQGNKKQAIKDLREAIRRGLKSAETIEKDSNLRALSSDPEFQKILRELHATGK